MKILIFLFSVIFGGFGPKENTISVFVEKSVKLKFSRFWSSTGFCPPLPHETASKWFLSSDMTQNLGKSCQKI